MSRRPVVSILVLTAALLIGGGPYLLRPGGTQNAPGQLIGNVDMQRLFIESDARRAAEERIMQYGRQMGQRFDEVAATPFLTPEEILEYSDILNTEKQTDAQKQRLAAIKAESGKRAEEFQKLSVLKDNEITPQTRTRLRELTTLRDQQRQAMERLRQIYQQMVNEEDGRQMRQAQMEVREIVGRVAKERGFTQVFDSAALVYASIDLTPVVMPQVKKK